MKPRVSALLLLIACLLPVAASADIARFALVAGNNRGRERERSLRYAQSDAKQFATMLEDLGGVQDDNLVLLTGDGADSFREALAGINAKIDKLVPAKVPRAMLLIYFSGHSDGVNLEFGSQLLPYAELRRMIESSSAKVKITFIDSCQSGRLTSVKGGRPGPAFDLVLTDHIDADGTAIITSSSSGENSQESVDLRGSFYTHYLLSGLRGAADGNQDGKVTLAEVYQYAYDKTVTETARTLAGSQHPTYDYKIAGRGQVVLTDLERARAKLVFGPAVKGGFLVVRKESESVVAEMSKPYGSRRTLALAPGIYEIAQRRHGRLFSEEIEIAPGGTVKVDSGRMVEQGSLLASFKSGAPGRGGLGMFLQYGMASGALNNFGVVHQGVVGVRADLGPLSLFPHFVYGQADVDQDRLRFRLRMYAFENYVTWRFEYSVLDLFAGLNLGVSYGAQWLPNGESFSGIIFACGAVGGIDLPLVAGLTLQVFWEAGGTFFKMDGSMSEHLLLKGVLGLGYIF